MRRVEGVRVNDTGQAENNVKEDRENEVKPDEFNLKEITVLVGKIFKQL
jgi:hypothetical protein